MKELILEGLKTSLLKRYKFKKNQNNKILLREALQTCLKSSKRKTKIQSRWQVMLPKPKV